MTFTLKRETDFNRRGKKIQENTQVTYKYLAYDKDRIPNQQERLQLFNNTRKSG